MGAGPPPFRFKFNFSVSSKGLRPVAGSTAPSATVHIMAPPRLLLTMYLALAATDASSSNVTQVIKFVGHGDTPPIPPGKLMDGCCGGVEGSEFRFGEDS